MAKWAVIASHSDYCPAEIFARTRSVLSVSTGAQSRLRFFPDTLRFPFSRRQEIYRRFVATHHWAAYRCWIGKPITTPRHSSASVAATEWNHRSLFIQLIINTLPSEHLRYNAKAEVAKNVSSKEELGGKDWSIPA